MAGGLLRAAATASMVSTARANRAARHAIEQNTEMQAQAAQQQAQPVAPAPTPVAAAPAQDDLTAQLTQLANLKSQGIITEEEFQAKKKQILGI